jgi:hypothetical protein
METKEAFEIVLELAQLGAEKENGYVGDDRAEANYEAIAEVKDFKKDLVRN